MATQSRKVSIVVPVHNGCPWFSECLQSVLSQTYTGGMELCVYDDASTDDSMNILAQLRPQFDQCGINVKVDGHSDGGPRGVGYAKNQAVKMSTGEYICFLDADDVMHCQRVEKQLEKALENSRAIVGCGFHRRPEGSTERFTKWANRLTNTQLYTQAFTSHGPTLIMPTWFCHRDVVDRVGGFDQGGKGTPEDLLFFYSHLSSDGNLARVEDQLLMYRHHEGQETFSIAESTIWQHRVQFLQQRVLSGWQHFSIWNAGKQGRRLYRSLTPENQAKVTMFCDVDEKKIAKKVYIYEETKKMPKPKVPIVHFTEVKPPIIICIKMDLSGNFEQNLSSLNLQEGRDYIHFN